MSSPPTGRWSPGRAPVAVVMISLNEAHHIEAACQSLAGWAQEVFLVDSYSQDDTVEIALRHGVHVVQRAFRGFGDQWNFALSELPISAPWTMKIDPDERLTNELKDEIVEAIAANEVDGISVNVRLWFMGRPLPIRQRLLRGWRSGKCRFSPVAVNEHAVVDGRVADLESDIDHHDSPDLDHWLEKQNAYTTAEAIALYSGPRYAATPRFWGSALQRRMWLKSRFWHLPFRYTLLFLYNWLWRGAWRAGWVGFAWARLRSDVMRLIDYKRREMTLTGRIPVRRVRGPGKPDARVRQY